MRIVIGTLGIAHLRIAAIYALLSTGRDVCHVTHDLGCLTVTPPLFIVSLFDHSRQSDFRIDVIRSWCRVPILERVECPHRCRLSRTLDRAPVKTILCVSERGKDKGETPDTDANL